MINILSSAIQEFSICLSVGVNMIIKLSTIIPRGSVGAWQCIDDQLLLLTSPLPMFATITKSLLNLAI
jgi:hypothetical protein